MPTSTLTSLELQQIQSNEFDAPFKIGFSATMSVFQDLGYIISAADAQTGLISATGPRSTEPGWKGASEIRSTKATAFIEIMPSKMLRIRLNFVRGLEISDPYGRKEAGDFTIEDPQFYQEAFEKIQQTIVVRSSL